MTRVAVIGAGYWGKNLVRNFDALGALGAICDSSAEVLAALSGQYPGARTFADIEELLAEDDIDAVAIATPAATHGALVQRALEAGKATFVEKPLCLDIAEARKLKAEAEKRGLTLMIGHLLLYHPAFRALRNLALEGGLGVLRYIYSNRASLGKVRREENALWSFAPHDISMILNIAGCLPSRVICNGGAYLLPPVADTSLTHLQFGEGLQGHIFVSWLHPFKDHRMVVVGSEGMAVFDDVATGAEKLKVFRHRIGWTGNLPDVHRAEGEPIVYEPKEPLRLECEHFLECVRDGTRPISDADEAINVLTVLDGCQRSLSSGHPVELSDAR